MKKEIIEVCLEILGWELEEGYLEKHPEKVAEAMQSLSEREEALRYDVMHYFDGDPDKAERTVYRKNLNLIDTATLLNKMNDNISSYEYYYAKLLRK